MAESSAGPQLILTMDPAAKFADGDRILLHCTGHQPPLLLGSWTAPDDEETEAAYREGVTAVAESHRPQHAEWMTP